MEIRLAHLSITTFCNLACVECCYGMSWRRKEHDTIHRITDALKCFSELHDVTITGGEPTCHPDFQRIATLARQQRGSRLLNLETNCIKLIGERSLYKLFDKITVTRYAHVPTQNESISDLLSFHPHVRIIDSDHIPLTRLSGGSLCGREERVHYSLGRLYGCCIGPGALGSDGVPMCDDWRELLKHTLLPCKTCRFGRQIQ